MAPPAGIEPATYGLEVRRSLQLSYRGSLVPGSHRSPAFHGTQATLRRETVSTCCPDWSPASDVLRRCKPQLASPTKYDSFITD